MDQWQTYEVFVQQSRGDQHTHAGIVHAPNAEMALLFAKEQYARRFQCVNIWVVRTADVHSTAYDDADMFDPAFDKSYRESHGYKEVRHLIDAWKKRTGQAPASPDTPAGEDKPRPKVVLGKPGIVIGKKK
ncbi:MAG: phenylacetic acid degradation protein [Bacteroidetes bacterium]|nr:phenylacetic acid degradation protein [Bacteroidota bacterium]